MTITNAPIHPGNEACKPGGLLTARLLGHIGFVCSLAAGCLIGATAPSAGQQCRTDRLELWNQVKTCLSEKPLSEPCKYIYYDSQKKAVYVILHDINTSKKASYLIVPATPVSGIEDKAVLSAPVADFWKYGWDEATKHYLVKQAPENTGLAINSCQSRGQDLLHIHMACVKKTVRDALKAATIPNTWKMNAIKLDNKEYNAIEVSSLDKSPFAVLQQIPAAKDHMGDQSLAVIGSKNAGKYNLFNSYSSGSVKAEAEDLLDETCTQ